eukprot:gene8515-biopygen1827
MMAVFLKKCTLHNIATISMVGAVLQCLFFVLMFIPFKNNDPRGGQGMIFCQYLVCYVLYACGDTLTGTPTTTMMNVLRR